MNHLRRFLSAIAHDCLPRPKELLCVVLASICVVLASICVAVPIVGLVWLLGWITNKLLTVPESDNLSVGTAALFLILLLVSACCYVVKTWRKTK